jgi:hypothetical protein
MRQIEAKRPKGANPKRKESSQKKSKSGRKSGKKRGDAQNGDISLFELFEAEGPMEFMFVLADGPEEDEPEPAQWPAVRTAMSTPVVLRKPPSPPLEVKESPLEFAKDVEAMLAADLEPFKFKPVRASDPFAMVMKIIALGDAK